MAASKAVTVWLFNDGKPGHYNQSLGLVNALALKQSIELYEFPALPAAQALTALVTGRLPTLATQPLPDLIIGAGQQTHLGMLAARRCFGGKVVVLMRPALPKRCFDLSLIPQHDEPKPADNVIVTRGVLNKVRAANIKNTLSGLILVGGPSKHYAWDCQQLVEQIRQLLVAETDIHWQLADSRRTPADCREQLMMLAGDQLEYAAHEDCDANWLADTLAVTKQVWVSEDSVSMVYEALTAQARVGLLEAPRLSASRVSRGIDELVREGMVLRSSDWQKGSRLQEAGFENEADRCANEIVTRWFRQD